MLYSQVDRCKLIEFTVLVSVQSDQSQNTVKPLYPLCIFSTALIDFEMTSLRTMRFILRDNYADYSSLIRHIMVYGSFHI